MSGPSSTKRRNTCWFGKKEDRRRSSFKTQAGAYNELVHPQDLMVVRVAVRARTRAWMDIVSAPSSFGR